MSTTPVPKSFSRSAEPSGIDVPPRISSLPLTSASWALQERFLTVFFAGRWAAVATGIVLAVSREESGSPELFGGAVLLIWALFLTLRPHPFGDRDPLWWLLVGSELTVTTVVVAGTGGLDSVYLLTPIIPLGLLSYTSGRNEVVSLVSGGTLVLGAILLFQAVQGPSGDSPLLLAALYLIATTSGSFARRIVEETRLREQAAAREFERLGTANDLLQALHAIAQTLPSSFDLGDVIDSIRDELRAAFDPTTIVLLVLDEATGDWRSELVEGTKLAPLYTTDTLPPALAATLRSDRVRLIEDVLSGSIVGVSPFARSALYAPLRARDQVIGLLAIEHSEPRHYDTTEVRWLRDLSSPLALTLDNARWFGRLRRFGAEAERARIARDLHDRLAQSLAYVGFELERLASQDAPPPEELAGLEQVVRQIVTDLRETLYELRARVTEHRAIAEVAHEFCRRVRDRSGMRVSFVADGDARLPLPVEQELWLVLQEAVLNAERHSGAEHVSVHWTIDSKRAHLEVRDGGLGFDPHLVNDGHYGLVGMRERAEAVGASLAVDSRPGSGTTVRLELELEPEAV